VKVNKLCLNLKNSINVKQIEVVAAIIRKEDKIFATQRGYGEWKDWWEFPGGKMEHGETPEEALKRENLSSVERRLCTWLHRPAGQSASHRRGLPDYERRVADLESIVNRK
jgi:hypothetical protein